MDRSDFLGRLAAPVPATGLSVYAWALLPNHAHLLVRTGSRPLPRVMRSLLTGYAGAFNRRHQRRGHLFQNRCKSIVVEEEPYLLELVRYLHLNLLRAGAVATLAALARYPWTGHSAPLGTVPRPWQATRTILDQFGPALRRASAAGEPAEVQVAAAHERRMPSCSACAAACRPKRSARARSGGCHCPMAAANLPVPLHEVFAVSGLWRAAPPAASGKPPPPSSGRRPHGAVMRLDE